MASGLKKRKNQIFVLFKSDFQISDFLFKLQVTRILLLIKKFKLLSDVFSVKFIKQHTKQL
jgi:hypothetical protein